MKSKQFFWLIFFLSNFFVTAQNEFLKIELQAKPKELRRGEEGTLLIKIEPRDDLKVLLYPEFIICFEESRNFIFNKYFFTANELNVETETFNQIACLKFSEELSFPFQIGENAFLGTQILSGEIIYTVMFKDSWSVKTSQKFSLPLTILKERKAKK